MLLESLVNYYELLAGDETSEISTPGYSIAKVSYAIVISKDGTLLNIISLKISDEKGKKQVAQALQVPEQVKKTSGISPNFLCENGSYVFGVDSKGNPERSKNSFLAFKKLHEDILQNVDCDEARAILLFLQNWNIDDPLQNEKLSDYLEDIYKGANFIFKLDGSDHYIHQNKTICSAWESYKNASSDSTKGQCLVTGELSPIARLHPTLSGIKGGQAMGNTLVSFNAAAYESYGNMKSQGLNAPISEYATFAYGTVLNKLLSDYSHKIFLGDTTIVFWAQSKQSSYFQDIFAQFIEPRELNSETPKFVRDESAVAQVKAIFKKIEQGAKINGAFDFDEDTTFCILGLSPNAARISVRFFMRNDFGVFIEKLAKHYEDMSIEKQFEKTPTALSIWRLLNETVAPTSKNKAASPLLAGSVFRSILTGSAYPVFLFTSVMMRIRAEKDINYAKASIIKGYLLRCPNKEKYKEVLSMSLNPTSTDKAYVLGRLFAVLEKAQMDANPTITATIKDRYFTAACANPAITFPVLLKLSNYHMSKSDYGYQSEKRINAIMELLNMDGNPLPKNLSLEQQGVFIIGYYHQKNAIWNEIKQAKKEDK
ncbi:MAG: type I-C CRISPR-associated protein Cas8c/Csd1 [Oscillospiraceae bacterium]